MEFIFLFIGWLAGVFIGSFTLVQILIIINFGIPITRKFTKEGQLKDENHIIRNYIISTFILGCIFLGAWLVISNFFPSLLVGFWIGAAFSVFLGLGKSGKNSNNISDYIETNKSSFKEV